MPLQPDPLGPDALPLEGAVARERKIEKIDLDELDKDNLGWTRTYITTLTERLQTEQAAASPDFVMISYLKRELATYQELMTRVEGQ